MALMAMDAMIQKTYSDADLAMQIRTNSDGTEMKEPIAQMMGSA